MAVVRFNPETRQRTLDTLRWGLVPFWAKDVKIGYTMINAKSETIVEKAAFRDAFKSRRCLIQVWVVLSFALQKYFATAWRIRRDSSAASTSVSSRNQVFPPGASQTYLMRPPPFQGAAASDHIADHKTIDHGGHAPGQHTAPRELGGTCPSLRPPPT
jgi:hypothetical protein